MNFIGLQKRVSDLIKAHSTFEMLAATTVFEDLGHVTNLIEQALNDKDRGYAIGVWPPTRGVASDEAAARPGVDAGIVVQFLISPKRLVQEASPADWVSTRIKDIIAAVLAEFPEPGGVRFQLASDAFELMGFDDGLIVYHIRFVRFAVFGLDSSTSFMLPPQTVIPTYFKMIDSETEEVVTITIEDGVFVINS